MPDEKTPSFTSSNPAALVPADLERAAETLGCDLAAIRAVVEVESLGNGFQPDARPKILFERHIFHRETGGRWSRLHPDISSSRPGGYLGGAREYWRLEQAMRLDYEAALRSASWGAFQIMGFNHRLAGFATVELFVAAMVESAAKQLEGFVAFIEARGLAGALRTHDWASFARGYNGSNYRINRYDQRLAEAYARFRRTGGRPVLREGTSGDEVARLQAALGIAADGDFGPITRDAVMAFQAERGLVVDGIVGKRTWMAILGS